MSNISQSKSQLRIKKQKEKLTRDIQLLELKQKKKTYKKMIKSGNFSKHTICFCILFTAFFAILCLYVQYKTGYETYNLLRIIAAVFGGELLMLLFKRIWTTDDNKFNLFIDKFSKRSKQKNNKKENDIINDISDAELSNGISGNDISSELSYATEEINNSIKDDGGVS